MKKETQVQKVAKHLIMYGKITIVQALNDLYITRLAARVGEIKDRCIIDINVKMVKWGDSKIAEYSVDHRGRDELEYCLEQGQL